MAPVDENTVIQPHYLPWHRPVLEKINSLKTQQRLPHAILIDSKSELDGAGFIWGLAMLLLCDDAEEAVEEFISPLTGETRTLAIRREIERRLELARIRDQLGIDSFELD